jgi:hypothetical protein
MIGVFVIGTTTTRRVWDYIYLKQIVMQKRSKTSKLGLNKSLWLNSTNNSKYNRLSIAQWKWYYNTILQTIEYLLLIYSLNYASME